MEATDRRRDALRVGLSVCDCSLTFELEQSNVVRRERAVARLILFCLARN